MNLQRFYLVGSLFVSLLFLSVAKGAFMDESVRYKNNRTSYAWAGLGFASNGGLGLGGNYERLIEDDLSWSGFGRFYSEGSAYALGADLRLHFPHFSWNFYFAPGLAFGGGSIGTLSYSGLATTTALGGMIAISRTMTLGVENRTLTFISGNTKPTITDWLVMMRYSF
jgi:hypothetical protein